MNPYLWIAYDYTCTSQCLTMLDTILEKHPDINIIHEIGRPTLLHAALEGFPIVTEFRKRLNNCQMLVADFKDFNRSISSWNCAIAALGSLLLVIALPTAIAKICSA